MAPEADAGARRPSPPDIQHGHHRPHHKPHGETTRRPPEEIAQALPADSPFRSFGLDVRILAAIADLGFVQPTAVQMESLPLGLSGQDLAGRAQTGTGKTAAFLITIIQHFLKQGGARQSGNPMALVLAPTRELALQIGSDADLLGKYAPIRRLVVYGGMDHEKQRRQLADGVDLVVATPGRLLDYMGSMRNLLSEVEILVIDEADRMLDMGFIPDVRRIISKTPPPTQRQSMLFSATLSPPILRLAESWMRAPVRVEIDSEQVVAAEVEQVLYAVTARDKLGLLLWLLDNECGERVLVFCNRRCDCDNLANRLLRYGVNCEVMSGDVPQKKRLRVLEDFRAAAIRVIVATDVAGRGIHVDNISHVINYDLPYEPDDYVHRIGRTGRAGVKGKAIGFACEEGSFILPAIEEYIKDSLPTMHPTAEMVKLPHPPPLAPGGAPAREPRLPPRRPSGRTGGRTGGRPGARPGAGRGGRR